MQKNIGSKMENYQSLEVFEEAIFSAEIKSLDSLRKFQKEINKFLSKKEACVEHFSSEVKENNIFKLKLYFSKGKRNKIKLRLWGSLVKGKTRFVSKNPNTDEAMIQIIKYEL